MWSKQKAFAVASETKSRCDSANSDYNVTHRHLSLTILTSSIFEILRKNMLTRTITGPSDMKEKSVNIFVWWWEGITEIHVLYIVSARQFQASVGACEWMCVCTYVGVYVCVHACVCVYVCTYVCVHACVCVCMYVRVHACLYVYICMYVWMNE
jgi:hypothetical protein